MRSAAALRAEPDGRGGTRLAVLLSAAPLSLRPTPGAVYLVGSAAGPLGGDVARLDVEVAQGATLTVRSVAASVALPGRSGAPSRLEVCLRVAGALRWLPEPLVAAARCDHHVTTRVEMAAGAFLELREELVLGRHGERPGRLRTRIDVDLDGWPLYRGGLDVGADGWDGPAVLGGARAFGAVLRAGAAVTPTAAVAYAETAAVLPLDGLGALVTATGPDAPTLRALLDRGTALVDGQ